MDIASSANLPGDGSNDNFARNTGQGLTEMTRRRDDEMTSHGAASLLDEASNVSLEEIDLGITASHGVNRESLWIRLQLRLDSRLMCPIYC
jgi:hypothetical protein